jgi:hypothetical protein
MWYKKEEQGKRVSWFYVCNSLTAIFGCLFAYGVSFAKTTLLSATLRKTYEPMLYNLDFLPYSFTNLRWPTWIWHYFTGISALHRDFPSR